MTAKKRKKRKKRVISPIRQEYMKQRKRLQSTVSRLRKKGYDISIRDIAGDIPKRVTKKAVAKLSDIRSSKQILAQFGDRVKRIQDIATRPSPNIPTEDEIALENFREKFTHYHPEVEKAVEKWIKFVLDNYGIEALSDALDDIDYEQVELSSFGGYLIPVAEVELYLLRISHFIVGGPDDDMQALMDEVGAIIQQYTDDLTDYEQEEWGNWKTQNYRNFLDYL